MSAEFFLDTNVIVYAFDASSPHKSTTAFKLIQRALETGSGVLSTQVVEEFLNVALSKFEVAMTTFEAQDFLVRVLNPLCRVYPDLALYEDALEIKAETGYSFYDSLILAGALKAGCSNLYSEDLQDGQVVRDVTIVNPFQPES